MELGGKGLPVTLCRHDGPGEGWVRGSRPQVEDTGPGRDGTGDGHREGVTPVSGRTQDRRRRRCCTIEGVST